MSLEYPKIMKKRKERGASAVAQIHFRTSQQWVVGCVSRPCGAMPKVQKLIEI